MDTTEFRLPMIHHIRTIAQIEINDVDAINLADIFIALSSVDVFGYQLGCTEQHTLEISIFIIVLYLNDKQLPLVILRQNVHTVSLVELTFLITLAFKKFLYFHFLTQKSGHQSFQDGIISLVSKQAFHRPIKSNVIIHLYISY